jgi:hypothetical protein
VWVGEAAVERDFERQSSACSDGGNRPNVRLSSHQGDQFSLGEIAVFAEGLNDQPLLQFRANACMCPP